MSQSKVDVRIGMIGYQFMGKAHSHAYRDIPFFFESKAKPILKALCGRNKDAVTEAAEKMGWESVETDWRALIAREDIDVIDIVTPNHTHAEIAIAAAEAGKHIITEKPLALTVEEAKRMKEAVEKHNVVHMICHNYRFVPAVQYAKQLIDEGKLGRIFHFRATYLQDFIIDPSFPLIWRLKKDVSGSGALGDIAAHSIDLARFLVGELEEVSAMSQTFIKERPLGEMAGGLKGAVNSEEMGEVTVDDAVAIMARFANGTFGTFEASRFATGNRNKNTFEINGEKGSLRWDMENMNFLDVYFTEDENGVQGFRRVTCTEEEHPYASAYWPAGHIIGYEHSFIHLLYEFVEAVVDKRQPSPNFKDGYINQLILDAIETSAEQKSWEQINYNIN